MGNICLAVLAKAPIVGQVKTRLIPFLTEQQACWLHQAMTEQLLLELQAFNPVLWVSEFHPWFVSLASYPKKNIQQQVDGHLGMKMFAISHYYLHKGVSPILIGTDCPFITAEYINKAKQALKNTEVVIGPANDGGYVLIALNADFPAEYFAPLFENIHWGSAEVLEQTLNVLKTHNMSYLLLDEQHDIDRPDDLVLLKQHQLAQKLPFLR